MKRLAFNGGEITPSMALRCDMDNYARSCTICENFDIATTGGISRRRGMAPICDAMSESVLIPFTYTTYEPYLLELSCDKLIIRSALPPFDTVQEFTGGESAEWAYDNLNSITWQQINSILIICSDTCCPMKLSYTDGAWEFAPFAFKTPPWNTIDLRDHNITIKPTDSSGIYSISYDEGIDELEQDPDAGDILRVSYYTHRSEAKESSADLRAGTWLKLDRDSGGLSTADSLQPGDKIAVASDLQDECYICTTDFNGSNDLTPGCTSPANYKDNFQLAEDLTGFDDITPIYALATTSNIKRGDKIRLRTGYWRLYTCIRPFDGATDLTPGCTSPQDYPAHIISGIPVGDAITCAGTWMFHCSGAWYGSYEVRRSYDSGELTALWETLAESISPIAGAENNIITGDEESEESYLRLMLTSVRYLGSDLAAGWPPDSCGNRLIVSAYKHNMQLKVLADGHLQDESPITLPLNAPLSSDDWSWSAFNSRYGYPTQAALHDSRLIFAATAAQPQTLWFSRTDDLNNFATGTTDDAGLLLTMSTSTQATICWMTSHSNAIMLGTEDGEWIITSSQGSITAASISLRNHGRIGSAHIPAIHALDRVLYCERGSGRVYQYGYSYESDSYVSTDLTIFADHIAVDHGGIISGTIMRKPCCVAAFVLADGSMACMTYNTMHNVNAWHRYTTQGSVKAACAMPDGTRQDRLFLITERDGSRKLERIDADSPYTDGDSLDYTSTVETTAFCAPDANESKIPNSRLEAYITTETPATAITVKASDTHYSPINHHGNITPGWITLCGLGNWSSRCSIGIRITGDTPCTILALQV